VGILTRAVVIGNGSEADVFGSTPGTNPFNPTFIKLVRTGAPDFGERFGEVVG
jgi:hypothetical protein